MTTDFMPGRTAGDRSSSSVSAVSSRSSSTSSIDISALRKRSPAAAFTACAEAVISSSPRSKHARTTASPSRPCVVSMRALYILWSTVSAGQAAGMTHSYPSGEFAYRGRLRCMPSPEAPLLGSCACGTVRFQVTAEFTTAGYCHCTRCQRRAGTPWTMNGMVPAVGRRGGRRAPTRSAPGRRRTGSRSRSASTAAAMSSPATPGAGRDRRRALRRAARRPGDPAALAPVDVLGAGLGADPGRRAPALRRASARSTDIRSNPIGYRVGWMHQQLAWYVGGPVLGLCVVALRWLLNERLGATGAWSDVVERVSVAQRARSTRAAGCCSG